MKLHQVGPNGIPRRAARTVSAVAMASHSIAKPHVGNPYSSANTSAPAGYGGRSASPATFARFPAAVIDCPSGPSRIQQVGIMMAGSVLWVTSRDQMTGMMISDANRLMPNIA